MGPLIRYLLAALVHGQRYIAPLLLFIVALCIFTINDGGALTNTYVLSAGSLLITMCWLTVTIVNHEDPVRRSMSVVNAGGSGRLLLAETLLALLIGAVLIVVGTIFPILSGNHVWTHADVEVGVLAQLTAVCAGTAVGLLCSRLVVPRPGYSLLLALVVVMALPLTPGLPPINPMLRLMSSAAPPADQLAELAGHLAVAVVLLAACAAATRLIAERRS